MFEHLFRASEVEAIHAFSQFPRDRRLIPDILSATHCFLVASSIYHVYRLSSPLVDALAVRVENCPYLDFGPIAIGNVHSTHHHQISGERPTRCLGRIRSMQTISLTVSKPHIWRKTDDVLGNDSSNAVDSVDILVSSSTLATEGICNALCNRAVGAATLHEASLSWRAGFPFADTFIFVTISAKSGLSMARFSAGVREPPPV